MNARFVPPAENPLPSPPGRIVSSAPSGRDREFLPAALEILETPAPPLPVALMLTICLFFAAALAWSFIGRLDVHAVALGKIERAGRAKVVQPLDPGKIVIIRIAAGDHVKAGDVMFELDPAETFADASAERDAENSSRAEVARRRAAIEIARGAMDAPAAPLAGSAAPIRGALTEMAASDPVALPAIQAAAADPAGRVAWDAEIPESFRAREQAVLAADLFQLTGALFSVETQKAQKAATRERLNMSIAFQDKLIVTLTQRVGTRQQAIDLNVGTKINLYDAKEELEKSQASLASDQGQLIETDAALKELDSEEAKTVSQFIADNENKLVDAARKADEAHEALAKADARLNRTRLVAPIDGVVQQVAVTTIGQVVTTGQEVAVITPIAGPLQVEALVANLDIGFIKLGQDAVIKVDAFPFTRFGVLHGKVARIATEAVDEQAAKRTLADATAASSPNSPGPSLAPGQTPSFVFPVTISIDTDTINVDGKPVALAPGMTVSAEIKTDQRRVIDYLFSPLARIGSEALRER